MVKSVALEVMGTEAPLVEELESGTYVWRFHFNSAVKIVLDPLASIANSFIGAFETVAGLEVLDLKGEDVAAGETIPPKGYKLRWTDNPEVTVIPYAHYDLVLTFKVSSPVAISTLLGLVLIVLGLWVIYMIVSTILEKVPPELLGAGAILFFIIIALLLAPKRRED